MVRARIAAWCWPRARSAGPTAAELCYGALLRNWGAARTRRLEARIAKAETVHSEPELVLTYARLRVECVRIGHALSQREHNADRWIAATA